MSDRERLVEVMARAAYESWARGAIFGGDGIETWETIHEAERQSYRDEQIDILAAAERAGFEFRMKE